MEGKRTGRAKAGFWAVATCLLWVSGATMGRAQDLTAAQVFEKFRGVYLKTNTVAAVFNETTIMDGQERKARGRLLFKKPNLLVQEYFDPKDPGTVVQRIVLDGQMSWSHTPWLNQVTRKAIDPKHSRELLPGSGENFEKLPQSFSMSLKEDEITREKNLYLLRLDPKPNGKNADQTEYLEVWIRRKDWLPLQFAYTNKTNDVVTIVSFDDMKLNVTPPKDAFKFSPPPGVEIVTIKDDYKSDR